MNLPCTLLIIVIFDLLYVKMNPYNLQQFLTPVSTSPLFITLKACYNSRPKKEKDSYKKIHKEICWLLVISIWIMQGGCVVTMPIEFCWWSYHRSLTLWVFDPLSLIQLVKKEVQDLYILYCLLVFYFNLELFYCQLSFCE